ncbi:hypothetical protein CF327_g5983 [Tilletia walkeri]|uniref:UDP-N-acetylglucosamine transferase subunit ALG13 n=1 Tax=Tilletia walkeri TaxID=117179 RepID=A0A8X7N519_9BASI|nr:hypothetical protein CF327_g5983 [Tilletia walkeri]KAE8265845.1 hypothetical protein A4X09_0g6500 [Tilletia walkeri]
MADTVLLVSVGSTRFDALINTVLHPAFLSALDGYKLDLQIQYGASALTHSSNLDLIPGAEDGEYTATTRPHNINIHLFPYTPTLSTLIHSADIVISHAGSGTILEVLRSTPTPPALIVVPNHTLMDDHQSELARALGNQGYLLVGRVADQDHLIEEHARVLGQQVHQLLAAHRSAATTGKAEERKIRIQPFPSWDPQPFAQLVDERLGFDA